MNNLDPRLQYMIGFTLAVLLVGFAYYCGLFAGLRLGKQQARLIEAMPMRDVTPDQSS